MIVAKKGYYLIKTIIFFSFSKKRSISIKELSQRLNISEKVMEQVLLLLKKAELLTSKRGPQGGYSLAKDLSNMSIMDILEGTGQKIEVLPVDIRKKAGPVEEIVTDIDSNIKEEVLTRLRKLKIKDLSDKMSEKVAESGLSYFI